MTVRAGREFLAVPGPTNIPDEVLQAMHRPAVEIYSEPLIALTDGLLGVTATVMLLGATIVAVVDPVIAPFESEVAVTVTLFGLGAVAGAV